VFQAQPDRQLDGVLPDTADDHDRGPIRLEARHAGVVSAKQSADLLGDRREDLDWVDSAGYQRGQAPQCGLLIGKLKQPGLVGWIMADLRIGGSAHVGAGVWRVHKADGSPMLGGPTRQVALARIAPGTPLQRAAVGLTGARCHWFRARIRPPGALRRSTMAAHWGEGEFSASGWWQGSGCGDYEVTTR